MINLNKNISTISPSDRILIKAIEHGIPVSNRPYAEIAHQLKTTEREIISRLQRLIDNGIIKRYGIVVRHKELGYTANGMVVWNIPDNKVDELGICIGKYACVTLSYRRPRRLPEWPYNLFTMIHASSRDEVIQKVNDIVEKCDLQTINHTILFSTRRFKQRGARYLHTSNRQATDNQENYNQCSNTAEKSTKIPHPTNKLQLLK